MMQLRRDVFQALADPTRRAILLMVTTGGMTAGAIAAGFNTARPTISKHLAILSACELLSGVKEGREIYYYVNAVKMKEVDAFLTPFRKLWEQRFDRLEAVMKAHTQSEDQEKNQSESQSGEQRSQ